MSDSKALKEISSKFNEDTLTDIVRVVAGRNDVRLVNYKMTNATSPGDNYITCVYRIAVEGTSLDGGQNYSFSLIVKGLPPNLGRRKTFHSTYSFANEVAFYEKVMPTLMEFQKRKNVKNPFNEVPR
ncbi:unnamed protein product [Timema podura]|uniref:Uncharacterized protein n=1 Tax=Timema podura TaxID=61482 RepID=A0ABN7PEP7_TIMPD|nr:unnamed protein product [Timema podura]